MSDEQTPPAEQSPAEKAKLEAQYREEMGKLGKMQEQTSAEAHNVAQESLGVMMAMGWTWDAGLVVIKDEEGKVVRHEAKLVIRPLRLGEWQTIQKERLRHDLAGGKSGIIV